jgi:hypothetical protein
LGERDSDYHDRSVEPSDETGRGFQTGVRDGVIGIAGARPKPRFLSIPVTQTFPLCPPYTEPSLAGERGFEPRIQA